MSEEDNDIFSLPLSGKEFDLPAVRVSIALLAERVRAHNKKLDDVETELKAEYVCRHEFKPVMRLVYGMASLMLVAVVTAIVNSVLKGHV